MNLKKPINENYAATAVALRTFVKLEGCDNVVHTMLFGNHVVVGKESYFGQRGLFFPTETKLSHEFLHNNNLYRDSTLNKDTTIKGYFEQSGRIKCMKFRGHKSEGFFIPITSLLFIADGVDIAALQDGSVFDEINGVKICEKYVPQMAKTAGSGKSAKITKRAAKVSRILDNQFRFQPDTAMFGKNVFKFRPETLISVTNKLHGTSFVAGKVLCKKQLTWWEKLLKNMFSVQYLDTNYDLIYSSRKVIKNDALYKDANHYYKEDIWGIVAKYLEPHILNGMTLYGEIVGFTPSGMAIQKGYDYGCQPHAYLVKVAPFKAYIYRITYTSMDGNVYEFSAKQVQDWCKANGLNAVPEYYYGPASGIQKTTNDEGCIYSTEGWQGEFLTTLMMSYNMEKDCELCNNKVPAEGIVLRIEGLDYDAYKLKSFRFREHESKELDKGEVDIETKESEEII